MSFSRGLQAGWGLVDNYERQNFQQERQLKADARAERAMQMQEEMHKPRVEGLQLANKSAGLTIDKQEFNNSRLELEAEQKDQLHDQAVRLNDANITGKGLSNEAQSLQNQETKKDIVFNDSVRLLHQLSTAKAGQISPELFEKAAESSQKEGSVFYGIKGSWDEYVNDIATVEGVLNQQIPFEQGEEHLMRWTEDSVKAVVGQIDEETGLPVIDADPIKVEPATTADGRPGFVVKSVITMQREDGTVEKREEYVTENRKAGMKSDNKVKVIPLEDVHRKLFGQKTIAMMLKATGNEKAITESIAQLNNKYNKKAANPLEENALKRLAEIDKMKSTHLKGKRTTDQYGNTQYVVDQGALMQIRAMEDEIYLQFPNLSPQGWVPPPTRNQVVEAMKGRDFADQDAYNNFMADFNTTTDMRAAMAELERITTPKKAPKKNEPKQTPAPSNASPQYSQVQAAKAVNGIIAGHGAGRAAYP